MSVHWPTTSTFYHSPLIPRIPYNRLMVRSFDLSVPRIMLHVLNVRKCPPQVNKWSFPGLLKIAWDKSFTEQNIRSGFKACGIYPFNRPVISAAAYAPSIPTDIPVCEVQVASSTPVFSGSTPPTSTFTSPVTAVSSDDIPVSPLPMTSLVSTNISLSSPCISNDQLLESSDTSLSIPLLSDVCDRNLDSSDHEWLMTRNYFLI